MKTLNKVIDWFKAKDIDGDLGANIFISLCRITLASMLTVGLIIWILKFYI